MDLADLSSRYYSFTKVVRNSLPKDGVIGGVGAALSLTGISSSESLWSESAVMEAKLPELSNLST